MRTLILGGTGVISTSITDALLGAGHEVTHLNRGLGPRHGPAPTASIRLDRTAFPAFETALRAAGPWDAVIDMVCYRPEEAESAIRAFAGRTRHYVFCSTVDVFAKPASRYPIEEDEPHRPVSSYGRQKAECEALLGAAHRAGDLPVTILRPAYTYGNGCRGVLHSLGWGTSFLDRLRRGMPVIVHGDGTGLWTATHASDAARAFVAVLGNERALGRSYNVVGDETFTWNQYVRSVAGAMAAPEPELVHIPSSLLAEVDPQRAQITVENLQFSNVIATSRAKLELGMGTMVPLAEGMARTIAWLEASGKIVAAETEPMDDRLIDAWRTLGRELAKAFRPAAAA